MNYQMIQIPLKDIDYKIELIDFTKDYNLLEISNHKQNYINQIILYLRQQYFIDYYKKFLKYLSLGISNIINRYYIMEIYAIDFEHNVIFESLQEKRYIPYYYPKRCILRTKKELIKEELNIGIMQFIKPLYISRDSLNESSYMSIENDYSILNFIRLKGKDDNMFIIYPESINNISIYSQLKLFNLYHKNLDLITELSKSNNNKTYCKMFEYDYKNDKVLYITNQFENDVDNIIYD